MNIKRIFKLIISILRRPIQIKVDIKYLLPNKRLEGKKIVITGGSRGIGYAMAQKFVSEGAEVLISGRNEDILIKVSGKIGCKYILFDSNDFENIDAFFYQVKEKLGRIDVLVNNAGISLHEGNIRNVTLKSFDAQFNTNLKSVYFLTQKFLEQYEKDHLKGGSVLFVSSERGIYVDDIPYGLTKAAINSFTQGLSYLFRKSNIRINAIAPGITATDMTEVSIDSLYSETYATGRYYLPDEVAEVACFLISDAAGCISGQIIGCENGYNVNTYRN